MYAVGAGNGAVGLTLTEVACAVLITLAVGRLRAEFADLYSKFENMMIANNIGTKDIRMILRTLNVF